MKNFRVFKTVNSKRITLGFSLKNPGVILFILLICPYLITNISGNLSKGQKEKVLQLRIQEQLTSGQYLIRNRTKLGTEMIPLELYVADKLARSTEADGEMEALKAQAILIRSGIIWQWEQNTASEERETREINSVRKEQEAAGEKDGRRENLYEKNNYLIAAEINDEYYGKEPITDMIYQAVAETAGVCVMYQQKVIPGVYFAVSNGATRNAEELGMTDYPYLKSVLCGKDYQSENYGSNVTLDQKEFSDIWEKIPAAGEENAKREKLPVSTEDNEKNKEEENTTEIIYQRDGAGYVLYLEYMGKRVTGENFRQFYGLDSACFYIKEEEQMHITVKGSGHGLGMSLYGAGNLAAEGKSCKEILEYFFNDVTITKIE